MRGRIGGHENNDNSTNSDNSTVAVTYEDRTATTTCHPNRFAHIRSLIH